MIRLDYRAILADLISTDSPSGHEGPVIDKIARYLAPLVDRLERDRLQNLIGVRCAANPAGTLLLDAHIDSVSMAVTGYETGGFLLFTSFGIDRRVLPASEVTVLSDPPLPGVVLSVPPHLQPADSSAAFEVGELAINTGLPDDELQARVPVGTPAVLKSACFPLQNDLFCGPVLDNRAGFCVLLMALEQLKGVPLDVDIAVLASTMEEAGLRGATAGAYHIDPDWAVVVDVTHGSTPDAPAPRTFPLGGGPAIGMGPNLASPLTSALLETAGRLRLTYQTEVMAGSTGTNAWAVQVSREGVATALLSVPLRYMHTPREVVDFRDLENTAFLLSSFIKSYDWRAGK